MPLLLLDFDNTITAHDTLNALITLAISSHSPSSLATTNPPQETTNPPQEQQPPNTTTTDSNTTPNNNNDSTTPNTNDGISNNTPNNPNNSSMTKPTTEPKPTKGKTAKQNELTSLWQEIVADYVAAHAAHDKTYPTPASQRVTLAQELAYLESVRDVEAGAVGRVSRGGFFDFCPPSPCFGCRGGGPGAGDVGCGGGGCGCGKEVEHDGRTDGAGGCPDREGRGLGLGREAVRLGEESIREDGKDKGDGAVRLRKGFGEFVRRVKGLDGWEVAVVSVNWSAGFIRGVMEAGCGLEKGDGVGRVVSNWVEWSDGEIQGPKELGREPLVTAADKLRAMKLLRKEGIETEKVVYFGDSPTDLACLVEADLGVVMADHGETKLLKLLERVGFDVPHVEKAGGPALVWARDFDEVLQSGVLERI